MANPNKKFQITDLDFDGIKASLKEFLKSQSTFTDYDFEGSGLSILLDILSYNTQYLAYYLNMVANEQFLDSADLRNSIVSIAKQLNYVPRSCVSATAVVDLEIIPTSNPPAKITIEKFTKFSSILDGTTYTFVTDRTYTLDLDIINTKYNATDVILKEGIGYTHRYVVDLSNTDLKYVIPNANVDTSTITVRVQASSANSFTEVYELADDVNELSGGSLVFFLQETEDSKYEVYFGDGFIGKSLVDNNIIIIEYITGNKDTPNKASTFECVTAAGGYSDVTVTTVTAAYGGSDREDIESVRFSAPKNYEAQNRAVTASDYKTILQRDYPNIDSLSVWGGENNDPPIYGKVFISLKPASGYVITEVTKAAIISDILKSKNVVTVIPEIIDPSYIFLEITSLIKYNPQLTTLTSNQLKNLVITVINDFALTEINKFENTFRYSRLSREIDECENSILNNLTNLKIQKRFTPILGIFQDVAINYNNAIKPSTISSSKFVVTSDPTYTQAYESGDLFQIDDDGLGTLRVYKRVGTSIVIVKSNAGTVNYDTGEVTLVEFIPDSIYDGSLEIKVSATPTVNDIIPLRNDIITLETNDVTVNMQTNSV